MIKQADTQDIGATLYHNGQEPNFDELEADGRVREEYDRNDLTAGDYTYSELDRALFLTGTGQLLWQWIDANN